MCRLYGFQATEPTKVECSLVLAQNSLLSQSVQDETGRSHADGWGVCTYDNGELPRIERQALAACQGDEFRRAASRVHARTVLAHVRKATVGGPSIENTHPFDDGPWAFAHNGTVRSFDQIAPRLREALSPEQRASLRGSTDSEHIFRLLLTLQQANPERPRIETLREGLDRVRAWGQEAAPELEVSMNVMWTNGRALVGSRLGRTLWYVERRGLHDCEVCGFPHVRHDPRREYRAVVLASEPISDEPWVEVPDGTLYRVDEETRVSFETL